MNLEKALEKLQMTEKLPELAAVNREFPALISEYYLNLIDRSGAVSDDPIYRQCVPDPAELADAGSSFDPLAETAQTAAPKLVRRFRDRVVLLATGRCAMRCRFCFRKRFWAGGEHLTDLSDGELTAAVKYLTDHPEIREVLVTGGDPLLLPLPALKRILDALTAVPSIETIRIGTRLPVVDPEKVTAEMTAMLGAYPSLWLMVHFNHPREVTELSMAACAGFIRRGIPVLNQSVLLKGVNDDAAVLEELFRALVKHRIKPHYLFHVDPVRGVRHFATGIECGLEILRTFRPRLSSLAVPTFAIDLPEGGGKVALQPDYRVGNSFPDIHDGRLIEYPDAGKL